MKPVVSEHNEHPLSLGKYISGFIGCVALTMIAYVLVTRTSLSHNAVIGAISCLAIVQFGLQMVLFLHAGEEHKPRWKLMVMFLMLGVVLLVVVGSLWIMNNLDYRMSPDQVQQYLKSQDSL